MQNTGKLGTAACNTVRFGTARDTSILAKCLKNELKFIESSLQWPNSEVLQATVAIFTVTLAVCSPHYTTCYIYHCMDGTLHVRIGLQGKTLSTTSAIMQ